MKHLVTFRLIDEVARTGSIRRAAERMAITPSALQRRLQSFEEELGEEIFERLSHGVRLNAAGEIAILHIRQQLAETDRLRSRLADLQGVRRGHVAIACSQALAPYFLPEEIAAYQREHPQVTFDVSVLEHGAATRALNGYEVDMALVFDTSAWPGFEVTLAVPQGIRAIMAAGHPLASKPVLRLRDCVAYPMVLPTMAFGGRVLLENALQSKGLRPRQILYSNSFEYLKGHVGRTQAITFQIPVGAPAQNADAALVSRDVDPADIRGGYLFLGQLRGRTLSVAASRFLEQLQKGLIARFGES